MDRSAGEDSPLCRPVVCTGERHPAGRKPIIADRARQAEEVIRTLPAQVCA